MKLHQDIPMIPVRLRIMAILPLFILTLLCILAFPSQAYAYDWGPVIGGLFGGHASTEYVEKNHTNYTTGGTQSTPLPSLTHYGTDISTREQDATHKGIDSAAAVAGVVTQGAPAINAGIVFGSSLKSQTEMDSFNLHAMGGNDAAAAECLTRGFDRYHCLDNPSSYDCSQIITLMNSERFNKHYSVMACMAINEAKAEGHDITVAELMEIQRGSIEFKRGFQLKSDGTMALVQGGMAEHIFNDQHLERPEDWNWQGYSVRTLMEKSNMVVTDQGTKYQANNKSGADIVATAFFDSTGIPNTDREAVTSVASQVIDNSINYGGTAGINITPSATMSNLMKKATNNEHQIPAIHLADGRNRTDLWGTAADVNRTVTSKIGMGAGKTAVMTVSTGIQLKEKLIDSPALFDAYDRAVQEYEK